RRSRRVAGAGRGWGARFRPAGFEQRRAAEKGQVGAKSSDPHPPDPASSLSLYGISPIDRPNHFGTIRLLPLRSANATGAKKIDYARRLKIRATPRRR